MDALSRAIHQCYGAIFAQQHYSALLETPCLLENTANHRWSWIGLNPRRVYRLVGTELTVFTHHEDMVTDISDDPQRLWDVLEHAVQVADPKSRLFCHVGYEATRWVDSAWHDLEMTSESFQFNHSVTFPDLLLCEMVDWLQIERVDATTPVTADELSQVPVHIYGHTPKAEQALGDVWQACCDSVQQQGDDSHDVDGGSHDVLGAQQLVDCRAQFTPSQTEGQFVKQVTTVLNAIQAGDVYQANLSVQFSKETAIHPLALYRQLVGHNPSPFGGVFQCPQGVIVSNSPERLVDIKNREGETRVSCRPIAGTRGRKANAADDARLADVLQHDPKERAEHVMLVDLIRNDMGRIALAGSVTVDELMTVERYTHVMHLVSQVSGVLPAQESRVSSHANPFRVLKATFPGGTITGCPKIRCVRLLKQLETHRRGPYTGSVGIINPENGDMDFNILIRTALFDDEPKPSLFCQRVFKKEKTRTVRFCVGAGLVADSVAEYEYKECLRKATSMLSAFYHAEQQATLEKTLTKRRRLYRLK